MTRYLINGTFEGTIVLADGAPIPVPPPTVIPSEPPIVPAGDYKPWAAYRPDHIPAGGMGIYSWNPGEVTAGYVVQVRPYVSTLPDGYTGAQGFDVSVSLTPGDFTHPLVVSNDPTGTGKAIYLGDNTDRPYVTRVESNTNYFISIRPFPPEKSLEVWTE